MFYMSKYSPSTHPTAPASPSIWSALHDKYEREINTSISTTQAWSAWIEMCFHPFSCPLLQWSYQQTTRELGENDISTRIRKMSHPIYHQVLACLFWQTLYRGIRENGSWKKSVYSCKWYAHDLWNDELVWKQRCGIFFCVLTIVKIRLLYMHWF